MSRAKRKLGEYVGEVLGVEIGVIEYHAGEKQHSIQIGHVGEANIEAVVGQNEADITIGNHLLAAAPGSPGVLAKSSKLA